MFLRNVFVLEFHQKRFCKKIFLFLFLHFIIRLERIDSTPGTEIRHEKSETIDMGGAKSYYVYYRMEDARKNRNIFCKCWYGLWYGIELVFTFFLWIWKLLKWTLMTSFWLILLIINFVCSIQLFLFHHSPVLGTDGLDFCSSSQTDDDPLAAAACTLGQDQCGIVNYIILPNVFRYLIPRYITLCITC